jgi:hypothetical protein
VKREAGGGEDALVGGRVGDKKPLNESAVVDGRRQSFLLAALTHWLDGFLREGTCNNAG